VRDSAQDLPPVLPAGALADNPIDLPRKVDPLARVLA
jgi:hypothetical protein